MQNYLLFTGKVGDEFLKLEFSDTYIDVVLMLVYHVKEHLGDLYFWTGDKGTPGG
jgi:hypothetical protein